MEQYWLLNALFGLLIFQLGRSVFGRTMVADLVITNWHASNEPDNKGRHVNIRGRSGGLLMWILSLLRVEATSSIEAGESHIEFTRVTLSSKMRRVIPLSSVSSSFFGYTRPLVGSIILFLWIALSNIVFGYEHYAKAGNGAEEMGRIILLSLLSASVACLIYYWLNRRFTLGFLEAGGREYAIQFKASVIENKEINEKQAQYICALLQTLIENDRAARSSQDDSCPND
jgi:hypothetical protein